VPESDVGWVEQLIIDTFEHKKKKAGYRTIKMLLERNHNLVVNHKKIKRIMKKHQLITKIRQKKKYTSYNEKSRMSNPLPDLVKRKFRQGAPDRVHSADITEIRFMGSRKAYLFAVKDPETREIVSCSSSTSPDARLVTEKYRKHLETLPKVVRSSLIVHTDQGGQFYSDAFFELIKSQNVKQSMSRKGNCLDNSPIESWFGHMKDEVEFSDCRSISDVDKLLTNYAHEYNVERPQWGLKGKTPAECRGQYN